MPPNSLPAVAFAHPNVGQKHPLIDKLPEITHRPLGVDRRDDGMIEGYAIDHAHFEAGDVHALKRFKPLITIDRDGTGRTDSDEPELRMDEFAQRGLVLGA